MRVVSKLSRINYKLFMVGDLSLFNCSGRLFFMYLFILFFFCFIQA